MVCRLHDQTAEHGRLSAVRAIVQKISNKLFCAFNSYFKFFDRVGVPSRICIFYFTLV